MRREIYKEVSLPEGIEVEVKGSLVKIKGPEGEISRKFPSGKFDIEKKENSIFIGSKTATKKEKKLLSTVAAHIKNMVKGVQKKFEYELKAVFSHFPVNLEVKGREVIIKNFLGEKVPRTTKIPENVDIEIKGNVIKIKSANKELAGQAAANLETATKIRARDRRVFQDGIYITKKAGGESQ